MQEFQATSAGEQCKGVSKHEVSGQPRGELTQTMPPSPKSRDQNRLRLSSTYPYGLPRAKGLTCTLLH